MGIYSIIQSQRLKLPPTLIIFNQNVHVSLTFSGFLRNQTVQSNKKLFRERERERVPPWEEERVAREEIRVLEVRRERENDNDNDNDSNDDD